MALLALAMLGGCDDARRDGPIRVSIFGDEQQLADPAASLSSLAGQMMFVATAQGLVSYDAAGEVVPGLAQRWIVVDDGRSYIFRLRRARWPDGKRVDARDVRRLLLNRIATGVKRDPYGVMASVSEVLAMTGDVIEIRLQSPQPDFLLAMAQPEMGIAQRTGGTGPYQATSQAEDKAEDKTGDQGAVQLTPIRDADEEEAVIRAHERQIVRAERASKAMVRFERNGADLVLGGTLAEFPYIAMSDVPTRAVRFDPVQGLFGLVLSSRNPIFDDAPVREALSMAVDRQAIISYFDMSRWKIAERILPQQLNLPHPPTQPGWAGRSMEERRNFAIGVIARWQAQHEGKPVELTIALPPGPGMDLLFLALKLQYRAIGVSVKQVEKDADLTFIDEVAPYDSVAWYLGRLSCARKVHCNKEAEEMLKQSAKTENMTDRLLLLGQAEPLIQGHNGYIPLAMPVRWSLAASRLNGFVPSPRGDRSLRGLIK
ncbi:MAG: ABC transporter substrate-binding protein [Sphingobium sp.]